MRTVAILGPIPRDRIVTHRDEVLVKYGCALYTVAALSALMEPTDRICPVVHVRKQDEEPIKELHAPMLAEGRPGERGLRAVAGTIDALLIRRRVRGETQT